MSKKINSNDVIVAAFATVIVGVATLPLVDTIRTERAKRKQIRINRDAEIADIQYAKTVVLHKLGNGDYDAQRDIDAMFNDFEFYRMTHRLDK